METSEVLLPSDLLDASERRAVETAAAYDYDEQAWGFAGHAHVRGDAQTAPLRFCGATLSSCRLADTLRRLRRN
jgi:hypothetical protein